MPSNTSVNKAMQTGNKKRPSFQTRCLRTLAWMEAQSAEFVEWESVDLIGVVDILALAFFSVECVNIFSLDHLSWRSQIVRRPVGLLYLRS